MGLRCLLGHDFGDRQTEGNREDRGDEVVVTMREFRECTRCGYQRTISENKEVKPRDGSPADAELEDSESLSQEFSSDGPEFEEMTAEEDDGEILEDDDEPVRGHGEWPDSGMDGDDDNDGFAAWPDPKGEDKGFSAEPSDGRPAENVEFIRGGLTPEARATEPGEEAPEGGTIMNAAGAPETDDGGMSSASGTRRASPGPSPMDQQRPSGIDTVVVCPECGNEAPSIGSSLRSGDICPNCHQGYMVEREQ